jgi:excinuclease UvrABC nuclease subunit
MVVCEDGRMKRSEYRKFKIRGTGTGTGTGTVHRPSAALSAFINAGGAPPPPAPAARLEDSPLAGAAGARETDVEQRDTADPPLRSHPDVPDVHSPQDLRQQAIDAPDARRPDTSRILDDFKSMHEVVLRRYRKLLENGGPFPDLVLIDGGKGQLSAAYGALQELGLGSLVAAGIAKKEELLFTRDRTDGLALSSDSPALLLIQRIRDEAHRFAVTFHRQSRTKRDLHSELDAIPGVGPRRRKTLLTTFGSVAGVRRATREELVRQVGARCADAVLAHFAKQG